MKSNHMNYKHLFGPVPSRRLGISLGVDLVPMKTCSLNCIYCECGKTTDLTLERKEYMAFDAIIKELNHYFAHNPEPDYLTFSGSGEPTLNSKIGNVLNYLLYEIGNIPVALLTNGTLLTENKVRKDIQNASIVIPSLDAATDRVFRKINRPPANLKISSIIDGLTRFRTEYKGKLWLEVFIVPGINDSEEELTAIKKAIKKIKPDRIQLNTLDRPGPVSSVRPATPIELENILDFWQLDQAAIIADPPDRKNLRSFRNDIESAVLGTIKRRPCTLKDLSDILGMKAAEVNKYLAVLEADKKIKLKKQKRGYFYKINH